MSKVLSVRLSDEAVAYVDYMVRRRETTRQVLLTGVVMADIERDKNKMVEQFRKGDGQGWLVPGILKRKKSK